MSKKYVYMFSEGNAGMRNLLGGKGANLAEMTNLGLPVPYGFTISTEACTEYNEGGKKLTDEMIDQIEVALAKLEEIAGKKLGDPENPLLVSVRSGARASMPGTPPQAAASSMPIPLALPPTSWRAAPTVWKRSLRRALPTASGPVRPMVRLPRWMSARWASCWNPTAPWRLRMPWQSMAASSGQAWPPGLTSCSLRPLPICMS